MTQDKTATMTKEQIDQLKEMVEKISILLHDLTPGGSEFANDPEYCAKWIRENRLEESKSLKQIIASQKERIKELEEGSLNCFSVDEIRKAGIDGEISSIDIEHLISILTEQK